MAQRNGAGMFPREVMQKPPGGLVKFDAAHKLTLMAHSPILNFGQAITPRWAASSPMPASGTRTH